ncbi:MAG: hypothetical protein KJO52_05245 [Maribacter sp.]|nr:hypothetical protein [Maribacter sp.]
MKTIKINKRFTDHFINALLIFASVFLAFWLNEVRIEKKEKELAINAKFEILAEWKINLSILERSKAYHALILNNKSNFFVNNLETISHFDLNLIPGFEDRIQKETTTNNSKGLVVDQQINFDVKTKLTINQINEQHLKLTMATNALDFDFLNQRELFDKSKVKENYLMFYSLLEEIVTQESIMIERLKVVINDLNK